MLLLDHQESTEKQPNKTTQYSCDKPDNFEGSTDNSKTQQNSLIAAM